MYIFAFYINVVYDYSYYYVYDYTSVPSFIDYFTYFALFVGKDFSFISVLSDDSVLSSRVTLIWLAVSRGT